MSEEMKQEVETPVEEKSATEQVLDLVKSATDEAIEVKADKSAMEALEEKMNSIEMPAVDNFVEKSVVEAQAEVIKGLESKLEGLEATISAAPAVAKSEEPKSMELFKNDVEAVSEIGTQEYKMNLITKSELTTNNTADTPIGDAPIYADLVNANMFRTLGNVFSVGSASFKLPKLSNVGANRNQNAGSQTEAGDVGDVTINIDHYNSLTELSVPFVDDLPGVDSLVLREQAAKIGDAEATQIVSVMDAATVTEQNFDISEDDLADYSVWQQLIARLPSRYWGTSTFVCSPMAWTKLSTANHSGTGSPLIIDPVAGGFTLWGRPVVVAPQLDAGGQVGDNAIYFGDFSRALLLPTRTNLSARRVFDNKIDAISYYTSMRAGAALSETAALVRANAVA